MKELQNPADTQITSQIACKESFMVRATGGNLMEYCSRIESIIESKGMSCRIRTRNRTAVNAALALTGVGLTGLVAQAAHNVATFNPDWEIIRNPLNNKIQVKYRRKK